MIAAADKLGAVRDHVAGRRGAMLELVEELVKINSYTKNKDGGGRVADILEREASALGLGVRRVASETYADHLILETERGARSAEGAVALVGHLDTVFPEGTFEGYRLDGDIARGPGVLDMKGGLVVALEAIRAVRLAGLLDRLALRFVIVSEEEIGSPEGRPILQRELAGASAALVFEAGRAEDRIITTRKGTGSARIVATGRAAHAALGHKEGRNAIWAMAKFVDGVQALTDYARGVTVNVGVIEGGDAKNTVPDRCEAELDFRFQTVADADATFARMKEIALEAARAVDGTSLELAGGPARYPLEKSDASVALFREYGACAKEAGLGSDEAPLIAGGSDASSTSAIGIPSIDGLGPRGSGFHTKEELIEISSLEPKAAALAAFLAGRASS
jgi:glutamate carboxypeptidase